MTDYPGPSTLRFSVEGEFLVIEGGSGDTYNRHAIRNGAATIDFANGTVTYTTRPPRRPATGQETDAA